MIDFIIYTLFTLYTAASWVALESDLTQIVVLGILSVFFIYKRRKIDNSILLLLAIWCIINVISLYLNRLTDFKILTFLSITVRMLFAYFMVKIVGARFFDGLFKYWFFLCLIGFPFYVLETIFPSYIQSLAPKLNFMTGTEQTVKGGFYLFFYMHSAYSAIGGIIRNCGFMWEPGAYAGILIFMIIYRLFINNFKIDWKLLFLTLCLITTFSTAGYLALFCIILFYFYYNQQLYQRHKAIIPTVLFVVFLIGYGIYINTNFLSEKVENYAEQGTKSWGWSFQGEHVTRVSRLGIMIISVEDALINPWGNGIITSDYIIEKHHNANGPNSIAQILRQWGWLGFIVLFFGLYNFKIKGQKGGLIFLLPMSIILFSNPFHFRNLLYAIVFSVICIDDITNDYEIEFKEDNQYNGKTKIV